ncbi:MAG: bifunctional glutamate N-acetyltransferase/amino-acid acetyltransferase ArgJ [Gammaproteobacteria bacterium]|nr:bifunctional glutamate N-acetyltransferase/amino-acid acetyltransferase ArgJ [Gammaproteobacteria bacterium]
MAVGIKGLPHMRPIQGIRLGAVMAGIRKADRRDLVIIQCDEGTTAAAVFTQNQFAAPPVLLAKAHLRLAAPRALIINTGYANAATGERGLEDARRCCQSVAERLNCAVEEVLPFSTGVIGEPLPVERIVAGIPAALEAGAAGGWSDAASGIMTTDTVAKGASLTVPVGGREITITGIAKGSGMIHPNMATMLAFVATDAVAQAPILQAALEQVLATTFNAVTVDGDTSTNDALVLLATGRSGVLLERTGPAWTAFVEGLEKVCMTLAQAIVRDGEGATKFVTVRVTGGRSVEECRVVANTIALSPLVKTALFASDPNWGRILMAVGRAPIAALDTRDITVMLGDVCVFRDGAVDPGYSEEWGRQAFAGEEIRIGVDLGQGGASATVFTSDLSYEYVRINGAYRT